jgi:hypothetical protein
MVKMFDSIQKSFDTHNLILNDTTPHMKELILLDLTRKSSDLSHRQQLQQLLVNALNDNDLNKAFLINSFLNPNQTNPNNANSNQSENFLDLLSQAARKDACQETDYDMDQNQEAMITQNEATNSVNNAKESTEARTDETIVLDKGLKPRLRGGPLSPIRHLICSPGLEEKAHKYKIVILYRGTCNGYCYANKPWTKQSHMHYIVNTVNCNDHVSRLVKKQGIQFYNSFVLQTPDRWNQLIQLYKMEKVKETD